MGPWLWTHCKGQTGHNTPFCQSRLVQLLPTNPIFDPQPTKNHSAGAHTPCYYRVGPHSPGLQQSTSKPQPAHSPKAPGSTFFCQTSSTVRRNSPRGTPHPLTPTNTLSNPACLRLYNDTTATAAAAPRNKHNWGILSSRSNTLTHSAQYSTAHSSIHTNCLCHCLPQCSAHCRVRQGRQVLQLRLLLLLARLLLLQHQVLQG